MYKQLNIKLKGASLIEFWIVTGCLILSFILSLIDEIRLNDIPHTYFVGILAPVLFNHIIVFICYAFICFYMVPVFENQRHISPGGTLFILIFMYACITLGIINLYFAVLLAIKLLLTFFNRDTRNTANMLYYDAALLTASWILLIVAALYLGAPEGVKFFITFTVPAMIIVYLYSVHRLLPATFLPKKSYARYYGRMMGLTLLSCIALLILGFCFKGGNRLLGPTSHAYAIQANTDGDQIAVIVISNFFAQLILVGPFSWNIFKRRNEEKDEEIKTLKTELGKSDASLTFLKSQINPHFLFNALNTLYGTALQENAERTGEGIQKLGDMMRFMLQENIQDKIALSRDTDYLKNYILLQKLRTSTSSDIVIETQIEDITSDLAITPMLLIPFVENAFKHGISLINPSHIKVTLNTSGNTLYFDVHNSIHIKADNDPEKGQSGIGLENVKQRLALLYPDRHELVIRQNATEFFVHLTLQLDN